MYVKPLRLLGERSLPKHFTFAEPVVKLESVWFSFQQSPTALAIYRRALYVRSLSSSLFNFGQDSFTLALSHYVPFII